MCCAVCQSIDYRSFKLSLLLRPPFPCLSEISPVCSSDGVLWLRYPSFCTFHVLPYSDLTSFPPFVIHRAGDARETDGSCQRMRRKTARRELHHIENVDGTFEEVSAFRNLYFRPFIQVSPCSQPSSLGNLARLNTVTHIIRFNYSIIQVPSCISTT